MNLNHLTRVGDDSDYLSERDLLDVRRNTHMFSNTNHFKKQDVFGVAFSQPGINVRLPQTPIQQTTKLTEKYSLERSKPSLTKRPYLTIPYLGRGAYNNDVHENLQKGFPINRNAIAPEKKNDIRSFPFTSNTVQDMVANPSKRMGNNKWVRGGLPSRDLYKDHTYRSVGKK